MSKGSSLLVVASLLLLLYCPVSATPSQQELTLGVPVTGSLAGTGDEQMYQVIIAGGHHLTVILDGSDDATESPPDRYDLYMKYGAEPTTADYDQMGSATGTDQAVEMTVTTAGVYYILVHATEGGGDYSIVAHTAATFPTLTPGNSVSGTLQATGDIRYYQVTMPAGQRLAAILDGSDNTLRYGALYVKFGRLPTTADYDDRGESPGADQAVEITSTVAGTYYLVVASSDGAGSFSIVAHDSSTFPTLEWGTTVSGALQGTGDIKYYQVTKSAGQRLTVLLDGSDNATEAPPDKSELYVKFGRLPTLLDHDDVGDSPDADQAVEITSTLAGTYYVMVRSAEGGGAYSIVAHDAATFPTLEPGVPVAGTLQGTGDVRYYQVTMAADQRLTVLLDGADNAMDSPPDRSELYVKWGRLPTLADHDRAGESPDADQAVEITSTVAGTYYIMVRSTTGGGNFSIAAHDPDTFPALPLEALVTGSMQGTGDIKYYQARLGDGAELTVILDGYDNALRKYDLYIKYGRLPTTIDWDDIGDSPYSDQAVRISPTRAGTYYVMVRSTDGGGGYSISARTARPRVFVPMLARNQ